MSGYLDELPVNKVGAFEEGFLALMRSEHSDLLNEIREKQELTDSSRERLKSAADAFAKVFA